MAAGVSKHLSHISHLTAGCKVWKCSFRYFCFLNLELHTVHGKFHCLVYFLFNLYSTVLKTFFWGGLSVAFSILIAVPIIRGSIMGLVPVSGSFFVFGSASGCWIAFVVIGNIRPSSSLGSSSGTISILASSYRTLMVSSCVAGVVRIFPRWGRQASREGGGNIRFCQIFPKTAWNLKNLDDFLCENFSFKNLLFSDIMSGDSLCVRSPLDLLSYWEWRIFVRWLSLYLLPFAYVFGNVMFSLVSVCLSVHRGGGSLCDRSHALPRVSDPCPWPQPPGIQTCLLGDPLQTSWQVGGCLSTLRPSCYYRKTLADLSGVRIA